MTRSTWLKGVLAACVLVTSVASADSWMPAKIKTYVSRDGAWRLKVSPREITSPLAYFEDKVAERPKAGGVAGSQQATASARMEHRQGRRWNVAWDKPLVNEVSPVDALVSEAGLVATFDNWHSMGFGKDAIAIYDAQGFLVRTLALLDFLPKEYIRALPRSVSSMSWRGEPRISRDGRELIVPIVVPIADEDSADEDDAGDEDKTRYVDFHFDMASGQLQQQVLDSPEWTSALANARTVDLKQQQEQEVLRQRFIAPLSAPVNGGVRDWYGYLVEAFFRIDPQWDDGYPATTVVPLPTEEKFALLSGYVGDAMTDGMHDEGAIMFASPSQDVLVQVLTQQAKHVKAGSLSRARIYVAVDGQHVEAAREALAHTGASFIQIDIEQPIPQRKERLDRYLENNQQPRE